VAAFGRKEGSNLSATRSPGFVGVARPRHPVALEDHLNTIKTNFKCTHFTDRLFIMHSKSSTHSHNQQHIKQHIHTHREKGDGWWCPMVEQSEAKRTLIQELRYARQMRQSWVVVGVLALVICLYVSIEVNRTCLTAPQRRRSCRASLGRHHTRHFMRTNREMIILTVRLSHLRLTHLPRGSTLRLLATGSADPLP